MLIVRKLQRQTHTLPRQGKKQSAIGLDPPASDEIIFYLPIKYKKIKKLCNKKGIIKSCDFSEVLSVSSFLECTFTQQNEVLFVIQF